MTDTTIRVADIQIGHRVLTDAGDWERVTGWYVNGRGRMVVEHGGRWHTYPANREVTVQWATTD